MEHLFYLIDEHDNMEKLCRKRGLIPYVFEEVPVPGTDMTYTKVYKYKSKNYIYTCLEAGECYSGFVATLMREPELSCGELLNLIKKTKSEDEKLGSMGLLLKKYPDELEKYLKESHDNYIYKLLNFIREFNGYSVNVIDKIIKSSSLIDKTE